MGRYQTRVSSFRGPGDGAGWRDPYRLEWGWVVGDRIRRLRHDRNWSLYDLSLRVPKPEGGCFSAGYFSRLERGWASPPLYTYIRVAEAFEVEEGRPLGPEAVQRDASPEETLLLEVLRRRGIDPAEALVRLAAR